MVADKMDDCTCFVRNIASSVDDDKLTEVFAAIGPVKKAFIVKARAKDEHKGFGFVTYALKPDAAEAARKLSKQTLDGRVLQVEIARKRDSLDVRNEKRKAAGQAIINKKGQKRAEADPLHVDLDADQEVFETVTASPVDSEPVHTGRLSPTEKAGLCQAVAIGCIPPGRVKQVVVLARKAGEVVNVQDPVPDHVAQFAKLQNDGCREQSILVHYKTGKAAFQAVSSIHRHKIGKGQCLWARQANGEGAHVKQWRIVVRNLPFGVTESELIDALSKIGFVWSVQIPRFENGRMKGFGFVSFTCRAHAAQALAAINGKEFKGRVVVADWSVSKAAYAAGVSEAPAKHPGETFGDDPAASASPAPTADHAAAPQATKKAIFHDEEGAASSSGSEAEDAVSDDSDADVVDVADDDNDDDGGTGDADAEAGVSREERAMLDRVLEGMLGASDAPDKQARIGSEAIGAKERAKAAKGDSAGASDVGKGVKQDPEAWEGPQAEAGDDDASEGGGKGRGSGVINTQVFVRGLPLDVSKIELTSRLQRYGTVKACRLVINKATGKPKGTAFVEFESAAAAKAAVAACQARREGKGPGMSIKGKQLDIDAALVQDQARALAAQQNTRGNAKDKRNLYLAKEGLIQAGSSLWQQLSSSDQTKRQSATREAQLKLKSPNFFVSPVRLHVMNVPLSWDQKKLKQSCREAVLSRASKAQPKIKQCIVLRDNTRLDDSGQPKSRGAGFVEFDSHEHALVCLRAMNNNPGLFGGPQKRPIVEFAIDNIKVLNLRERKQRMQQELTRKRALAEDDDSEDLPRAQGSKQAKEGRGKSGKRKRLNTGHAEGTHEAGDAGLGQADANAAEPAGKSAKKRRRTEKRAKGSTRDTAAELRREAAAVAPVDHKSDLASTHTPRKGVHKARKQQTPAASSGTEVESRSRQKAVDRAVDDLARDVSAGPGKRRKRKGAETDELDKLITKRSRALFGLDARADKQAAAPKLNTRWFD